MKKILTILILCVVTFSLFSFKNVNAEELKEDEVYLTSTKSGVGQKVPHFGGGFVTLPKKFSVYESEMRGVWVATVYNIAIGKQKGTTEKDIADYKAEFLTILDRMEEYGMNTLFFQIRPNNDAFYKSELNPWSEFLVGPGIDPGWDPLEWMIEETHKKGFDFQCWMNAYRVTTYSVLPENDKMASTFTNEELLRFKKEAIARLADGNFAKKHPEYVVMGEYDTRLILNPSEVAVQDFIVDSLKEIIENYDIDGMHFDDYFYLNGYVSSDIKNTSFAGGEKYDANLSGEETLNDLANYQEYLNNDPKYAHMERGYNLGEFRRENINSMMRKIRAMVDEYNEKNDDNVEFGSKPAAVWRSNSEFCSEDNSKCSPIGSDTHEGAYASYGNLFADTWKWVEEGLVDYIAPQVYYSFEDEYVPYADIVDWWAKMVEELNIKRQSEGKKNIKLYIAHGIYKYRDAASQFYNSAEIRNQIVYNKKYKTIVGSAFYSYECLYEFASDIHEQGATYLKNNWVKNPVYPIQRGEDDSAGLKVEEYKVSYDILAQSYTLMFDKMERSRVYGIYKVEKGATFDPSDVSKRVQVIYDPYVAGEKAMIPINDYDENYDYYIKVVSTNGHVSKEHTKIDFSNAELIESIKINYMSDISAQVLIGSKQQITADIYNESGNPLTYNLYFIQNGNVRKDRVLASGKIVDGLLKINFTTYNFEYLNSGVCLEVTDGKVSTSKNSNTFDIVEELTLPVVSKINDIYDVYGRENSVNGSFNILNVTNKPYDYEVYLISEGSNVEKLLSSGNTSEGTISVNTTLEEIYSENASIKLVLTQDGKTVTYSHKFQIKEPMISSESIIVDKLTPKVGEVIKVQVLFETNDEINYSIEIVDENNKVIASIDHGSTTYGELIGIWRTNDNVSKTVKVKVVLGQNGYTSTAYSSEIKIQKEWQIYFDFGGGIIEDEYSETYIEGVGIANLPTPTKEGYIFLGWYLNGSKVDGISTTQTGEILLEAKWKKDVTEYTVIIDGVSQIVEEGQKAVKPVEPVKEGYTFKGWYVGDTEYDFDTPVTSDLIIESKWQKGNCTSCGSCSCKNSFGITTLFTSIITFGLIIIRKKK